MSRRVWRSRETPVNLRISATVDGYRGIKVSYECPKCRRDYEVMMIEEAWSYKCRCGQLLCLRLEPVLEAKEVGDVKGE